MHFLTLTVPAGFRFDERLVKKTREIVHMSIRPKNNVAAAAAIAAVRSAFRHKFLAPKTDATAPTVARLRESFDSIDKHETSSLTL